jgi:hypothetical protein
MILRLALAGLGAALAAACTPSPEVLGNPVVADCVEHIDCGSEGDEVCVGGVCELGECVANIQSECTIDVLETNPAIAPFCCQPWEQCNEFFRCVPDPESPIGSQCLVSDDCPNPGDFCTGGTCLDPAGRTPCTATHQCGAGERCDLTVFLCVPDNGGCTFANIFPELECEGGFLCDESTGFCIEQGSEIECTADDLSNCFPGQQCDVAGRCVQCINDDDCGTGTTCNEATGSCISSNICSSDADCGSGRRCALATGECIVPECEDDNDCDDSRENCDEATYTCFLPPAQCTEDDEPNNTIDDAIPISGGAASNTVCRGDVDVLSFPINSGKRYRVTMSTPDFDTDGLVLALLNSSGAILDQEEFGFFDNAITVSGISGDTETGNFFARVVGSGTEEDEWDYTLTVEESDAPEQVDCAEQTAQGIEPNNTPETAHEITAPNATSFARCGTSDEDWYRIVVPALNGIEVTIEHETEDGDLEVELFREGSLGSPVDTARTSNQVETVNAPEGSVAYLLHVELFSTFSASTNQTYTLTATPQPRPAACDADQNEPDAIDSPLVLTADNAEDMIRCGPGDDDYFTATVPANFGGSVSVTFDAGQGSIRLNRVDDQGVLLSTSTGSTGAAVLDLPPSATETTHIIEMTQAGSGTAPAQPYQILFGTFDAAACVVTEPVENDSLVNGYCVGTVDETELACVAAPALPNPMAGGDLATECTGISAFTPGCFSVCGTNDKDWYRIGKINDGQVVTARLDHVPADGVLGLAIARLTSSNAEFIVARDRNTTSEAQVELQLIAPTVSAGNEREHGVRVQPEGSGAFLAQPYSLEITVSAPCVDDANEPNEIPGFPAPLRPAATPGDNYNDTINATLCGTDTDVYELYAFQNEDITATVSGLAGVEVEIGTRPQDPSDPAVTVATGVDNAGDIEATFSNPSTQPLYITVKRGAASETGSYTLTVDVQ